MFAFIKGKLVAKSPLNAILETAGIGYEILIPLLTFDKLPKIGEEATLFIHFSFSETDGIRLFGFYTIAEKAMFKKLISVSKIGPKTALSVLSTLSIAELKNAIILRNISLITTVPGIGKKSAERLVIELRDKISESDVNIKMDSISQRDIFTEAESALITLGYKQASIRKIFAELSKTDYPKSVEALIKLAIKNLYEKRNI